MNQPRIADNWSRVTTESPDRNPTCHRIRFRSHWKTIAPAGSRRPRRDTGVSLKPITRHADALHWLGVLLCQAGQFEQKARGKLLERAVAIHPADPAFLHNLGQACLSAGRSDQAVDAFERAAAARPPTLRNLDRPGAGRCPSPARRGMPKLPSFRCHGARRRAGVEYRGVPSLSARLGRCWRPKPGGDEAILALKAALAKKPVDATLLYHLALAHQESGTGQGNPQVPDQGAGGRACAGASLVRAGDARC